MTRGGNFDSSIASLAKSPRRSSRQFAGTSRSSSTMPEGPELNLSSQFINFISKGRLFAGKVRKNPIHKCAEVKWNEPRYTVAAVSRGKELKVFLQTHREEKDEKKGAKSRVKDEGKRLHIVFNFGMSGHFEFTSVKELPKHAHLSFFTNTQPAMALSFVDPRRFGKWQVDTDWSPNRGPCVMSEYPQFRCLSFIFHY